MINKSRTTPKKTILLVAVAIVMIVGVGLLYANSSHIKNLFTKDAPASKSTTDEKIVTNPNSIINYDPSSPSDNDAINEQKNGASNPPTTPVDTALSATITRSQVSGSVAQIRVLIAGSDNGTCTLKLTKVNATTVTKEASVVSKGTFLTCDGFDVPVSDLSAGNWKVQVILTSGGKQSAPAESSLQVGT